MYSDDRRTVAVDSRVITMAFRYNRIFTINVTTVIAIGIVWFGVRAFRELATKCGRFSRGIS